MAIDKYLDKPGLEHLGEVLVPEIKSRLKKVGELPTPSVSYLGQTYLLTAPQTGYIEGGIYKCEEVTPSTSPKTYYWKLISGNSVEYPQYMADERDVVLGKLEALYGIRNPIVIGFSTDQHNYPENTAVGRHNEERLQGIKTLRDITRVYPFNICVLGGDGGVGQNDAEGVQRRVLELTDAMSGCKCPLFHLIGNHDGYLDNDIEASVVFESHRTDAIKNGVAVTHDISTNCYYDDPTCNVRFIMLMSDLLFGYSTRLSAIYFLEDALKTLPTGYEAIIFTHHPLGDLPDDTSTRADWNEPLNWGSIVEPYADRIIACICGHVHDDKSEIVNGILYLSTTCAGEVELNDGSTRTPGTADFTAYDVMVIDRTTHVIHCVRYGNGNDRNITYRSTSYTNAIPISTDDEGNIFNEVGYKKGVRLDTSGNEIEEHFSGITGFIPVVKGDVIRLKNIGLSYLPPNATPPTDSYYMSRIAFYNSSKELVNCSYPRSYDRSPDVKAHINAVTNGNNDVLEFTVPNHSIWVYMRISANGIDENSIITVNEPIDNLGQIIPDDGTDIDFTNWEV